jgi:hypothetical protein
MTPLSKLKLEMLESALAALPPGVRRRLLARDPWFMLEQRADWDLRHWPILQVISDHLDPDQMEGLIDEGLWAAVKRLNELRARYAASEA